MLEILELLKDLKPLIEFFNKSCDVLLKFKQIIEAFRKKQSKKSTSKTRNEIKNPETSEL